MPVDMNHMMVFTFLLMTGPCAYLLIIERVTFKDW